MKIKNVILVLALCAASFSYGIATGYWRLPPIDQVRDLYRLFHEKPVPKMAGFTLNTDAIATALDAMSADIEATRNDLRSRVILPSDRVKVTSEDMGDGTRQISAQLYGLTTKSLLSKAAGGASCLRIYIQGHGAGPFDMDYHNTLLTKAVEQGCDFLSMSMVGLGQNTGPVEFPSGRYPGQVTRMDWREAHRHGSYMVFHDVTLPAYDFLTLFLSPHYYTIQSIIDDYENVSVMGISGGGWYTVWMAALFPEIDYSIVYAGSLPNVYRTSEAFHADYEEVAASIYDAFDYWQLYHLGSRRGETAEERVQYFVFNDRDNCCFMDPAASHFAGVAKEIYGDAVRVIVDQNDEHVMNVSVVEAIWQENVPGAGATN